MRIWFVKENRPKSRISTVTDRARKPRPPKVHTRRWSQIPPEGVPIGFNIATLGSRFGAQFLDILFTYGGALLLLLAVIYAGLEKTNGDPSPQAFTAAVAGLKLESPRGPIEIDAMTRDIIQTIYVRKVEKVDGKLYNVEFHEFPESRDPNAR